MCICAWVYVCACVCLCVSHLELGLQELAAGDDVSNLGLIQHVEDGLNPQSGVQSDHCNTNTKELHYLFISISSSDIKLSSIGKEKPIT